MTSSPAPKSWITREQWAEFDAHGQESEAGYDAARRRVLEGIDGLRRMGELRRMAEQRRRRRFWRFS